MRIAAVILAGGKGERLGGVNKAFLHIGGRRFIDRAVEAAQGCDPILVAVGREAFAIPSDTLPVLDLGGDYAGPLAGVAAAIDYLGSARADVLFSLAVDTPLFPRDFIERALLLLDGSAAVVSAYGPQDYPTNALWRLDAIRGLADEVRKGTAPRSLKRLAETLDAVRLDYTEFAPDDPFRNANTPEDLARLRRAQGSQNTG